MGPFSSPTFFFFAHAWSRKVYVHALFYFQLMKSIERYRETDLVKDWSGPIWWSGLVRCTRVWFWMWRDDRFIVKRWSWNKRRLLCNTYLKHEPHVNGRLTLAVCYFITPSQYNLVLGLLLCYNCGFWFIVYFVSFRLYDYFLGGYNQWSVSLWILAVWFWYCRTLYCVINMLIHTVTASPCFECASLLHFKPLVS